MAWQDYNDHGGILCRNPGKGNRKMIEAREGENWTIANILPERAGKTNLGGE
jgi:hypothetical protein